MLSVKRKSLDNYYYFINNIKLLVVNIGLNIIKKQLHKKIVKNIKLTET